MDADLTTPERMQVGELAQRAGISHRTVHYYERMGLITAPERKSGGYRYYGPDALKRLRPVDRLKQLGLSLEEIRQVLPFYAEDPTGLGGKREVMAILQRHLADTDQKLAQLAAFRSELVTHIARFQTWLAESDRAGRKPVQD